jgi:ABC-type multidrug transport system, ATPase component
MKIDLSRTGKRFNREWVFRNTSVSFISNKKYAITGINGSGKSTLLQCIGNMMRLSEGSINYSNTTHKINPESIAQYITFSAPYLELIEEMTLTEFLLFHQQFKSFVNNRTIDGIIEEIQLTNATHKQIRDFSSGMKQRVRLAQAIFSNVPIVLLDEPCSNLDQQGIELYKNLVMNYSNDRIIVISSNDPQEYSFCDEVFSMNDFKSNLVRSFHHDNG